MYKLLFLSLSIPLAIAGRAPYPLLGRENAPGFCLPTEMTCGSVCLEPGWSCCTDEKGGCPPSEYCSLGTNLEYGCCPIGTECTGPGGSSITGSVPPPISTQAPPSRKSHPPSSVIKHTSSHKSSPPSSHTKSVVSTSSSASASAASSTAPAVHTTHKSKVSVLPTGTTGTYNYSVTSTSLATTSLAEFTGAASGSYGEASPYNALGVIIAALFML